MRGAIQEVTHPLAHVSDQEVAHLGITYGSGNDLQFLSLAETGWHPPALLSAYTALKFTNDSWFQQVSGDFLPMGQHSKTRDISILRWIK